MCTTSRKGLKNKKRYTHTYLEGAKNEAIWEKADKKVSNLFLGVL